MNLFRVSSPFWGVAFYLTLLSYYAAVNAQTTDFTRVSLYSALPSCGKRAASYVYDNWAPEVCSTGSNPMNLRSCICEESSAYFESLARNSVINSCDRMYSAVTRSVETVASAYCLQGKSAVQFPSMYNVDHYFTDLPQIDELPPCAIEGVSSVFASQSWIFSECPTNAAHYADCVCSRSSSMSSSLRSTVSRKCSSWNLGYECATSANSLFSAYCDIASSGTTRFPTPTSYRAFGKNTLGTKPSVSIFISRLVAHRSLGFCLRSGLSRVLESVEDYCHTEVADRYASCICLNSRISTTMSLKISTTAGIHCDGSPPAQRRSMQRVFDAYCSLARREIEATPTTLSGNPTTTYYAVPIRTDNGGTPKRVIIGAVVGAVLGSLLVLAVVVFCIMRKLAKNRRKKAAEAAAYDVGYAMGPYGPQRGPQLVPQEEPPDYYPPPTGIPVGVPVGVPVGGPVSAPASSSITTSPILQKVLMDSHIM